MTKEPKWLRVELQSDILDPYVIPIEAFLILCNKPDLLKMYNFYIFIGRVEKRFVISQQETAKLMGFSYKTYLKKRKELLDTGLIEVLIENNNFTRVNVRPGLLWGMVKSSIGYGKKFHSLYYFRNFEELQSFTENMGKTLIDELKKCGENVGQTALLDNIYINNNITNNIPSNVIGINNIPNKTNTNKNTYAKEDYEAVLNAFKKYKGVGLKGPEISYHMRAIKMMFQAERKPKEIIDFMKWLHDNERNEWTPWVKTWTIWTVQKKLAEFIAGKLSIPDEKEELERI